MKTQNEQNITEIADFKPIKQVELTNFLLNNLQNFNLKPTSKLVLLYLSSCYNPKNADVFPKQKTIADKMGISEASVIRAIAELHKEGLIISERKFSNRYKFTTRLLSQCPKVIFLEKNKMQVNNLQIESEKLAKCELHEHEQCNKQVNKQLVEKNPTENKPVSVQNFEKIKKYAVQKGAKNPTAYAHAIIKAGNDTEILKNIEKEEKRKKIIEKRHIEQMQQIELDKKLACPPPAEWQILKAKLLANCTQ